MGTGQLRRRHDLAQVTRVAPVAWVARVALRRVGSAALALGLLGCNFSRAASAPLSVAAEDRAAIERILKEQDEAWNRGDLHAFVAGYAEGERMTYVGKGGAVVRGRAALEERYRKSYPEGRRGTLAFSDLDVRRVGPDDYLVLGKWSLALPPENPHGTFTLVLERGAGGFEIIHDHSSGND